VIRLAVIDGLRHLPDGTYRCASEAGSAMMLTAMQFTLRACSQPPLELRHNVVRASPFICCVIARQSAGCPGGKNGASGDAHLVPGLVTDFRSEARWPYHVWQPTVIIRR
jgi:hypothetical protein